MEKASMEYELTGNINRPDIDIVIISLLEKVESEDIINGSESG
jgi:hypothetical protein